MPTVLMICTANICRSPVAAALLQKHLNEQEASDWRVLSAGTWAEWERGASRNSIVVAEEYGMDISKHRAQMVTREMLEEADLVLCMTGNHVEALQIEFRQQRNKIYMLSEMVGRRFDVGDPYGRPLEAYERMANEVAGLIDGGLSRIIALAEENAAQRA
jgi:protein-tyrosine-phosphatase